MRSSLLLRLALVFGLAAIIGVPAFHDLEPITAQAQTAVAGMPVSDVWTGELDETGGATTLSTNREGNSASAATEALIVRFSRAPRAQPRSERTITQAPAGPRRSPSRTPCGSRWRPVERDSALAAYNANSDVLYAEPDYPVHAFFTTNDPAFPDQWALQTIGAPAAWNVSRGSSSIRVAVVDCGVFSQATGRPAGDGLAGHPDLRGKVALDKDFTGSSTGFDDYCNHGTHVAGIIGAIGNNGIGVSGLAPRDQPAEREGARRRRQRLDLEHLERHRLGGSERRQGRQHEPWTGRRAARRPSRTP